MPVSLKVMPQSGSKREQSTETDPHPRVIPRNSSSKFRAVSVRTVNLRAVIAIAKSRPEPGFDLVEVPEPELRPGTVKLRVEAGSVCGTDLHIFRWDEWSSSRIKPPRIVGHEFCGTIIEVGEGVPDSRIGEFVASESHITCGHCRQCLAGQRQVCVNTQILGVDVDGGFAPRAVIPAENARTTHPSIPRKIACFQDALGNAVHTVADGPVKDQVLLITGMGPIGLFAVSVAKALGAAKVYAVEVSEYRIELAKAVGADVVLQPGKDDVDGALSRLAPGGVDGVLEMSGHPSSLGLAARHTRPGGRVSMLGVYPTREVPIDMDAVIFKGLALHGIVGRRLWETWDLMGTLLAENRLTLDPIVTHELPYTDVAKGMELLQSGKAGKVVFTFPQD